MTPRCRRIVLVTGLSGAGKATILRLLEDLGYEAVDNPPLPLLAAIAASGGRPLAIGVDARTSGFNPSEVLGTLARLRADPALCPELIYASAEKGVLFRRYTESRRRHPLTPAGGRVADGIAAERALTTPLRDAADLLLDTSDLSLPALRRMIEERFAGAAGDPGMTVTLISFAYPRGLPREADLVFDARFLRNPHYDPMLRPLTGLDPAVAAFVEADRDFAPFLENMTKLLTPLLPRFLSEGKKYLGVAVGCTGGRHRSVHIVQRLRTILGPSRVHQDGWRVTTVHRELMRDLAADRLAPALPPIVQAQEA